MPLSFVARPSSSPSSRFDRRRDAARRATIASAARSAANGSTEWVMHAIARARPIGQSPPERRSGRGVPRLARKFLYAIVIVLLLAIAGAFAFRYFGPQIMRMAMVPSGAFESRAGGTARRLCRRQDVAGAARHQEQSGDLDPAGLRRSGIGAGGGVLHPPDLVPRAHALERTARQCRRRMAAPHLFLRGQASVFNEAVQVWAPRYRQATFGAFLTGARTRSRRSISRIATSRRRSTSSSGNRPRPPDHPRRAQPGRVPPDPAAARTSRGQAAGDAHRRGVCDRLAGVEGRRPAALGLPECATPDQAGCVLSWQSLPSPPTRRCCSTFSTRRAARPAIARGGHAAGLHQPANRHARRRRARDRQSRHTRRHDPISRPAR